MKKYVIISKDAMCCDYLHLYGEKSWQAKTPNIDALAAKGTLFTKYYTAAPSTVMSFFSMITGQYAHETPYEMYERKHYKYEGETFFTKLKKEGYSECHIIWDSAWDVLPTYFDCYRSDVIIHSFEGLREGVGVHKKKEGDLFRDSKKEKVTLEKVESLIKEVLDNDKDIFLWVHFPHVLSGRAAYGSDIDLFDQYVGMIRKYVPDSCIAITADHGNMNGFRGKLAYGFDVYNKVIRIPLITPRIDNQEIIESNVSSVDLYEILFNKTIPNREFIYSDSAYRAQKSRKLAIISGDYKYIFTKKTGYEELYDLSFDPQENFSLMKDVLFDVDRKINVAIREEYYYTGWSEITDVRKKMSAEKNRIWENGSKAVVFKSNVKDMIRPLYDAINKRKR